MKNEQGITQAELENIGYSHPLYSGCRAVALIVGSVALGVVSLTGAYWVFSRLGNVISQNGGGML
jgi:hypothetical protein